MIKKTLKDVSITHLAPPNLMQDPQFYAAAVAITTVIRKFINQLDKMAIYKNLDLLDTNTLDHLAYFFHVDFYSTSLARETKIELIRNAYDLHSRKGTKHAVELLTSIVFGEGEVEEWFEYDGLPFRFKVYTENQEATTTQAHEFLRAINSIKNARSILESVELRSMEQKQIFVAAILHEGITETFRQVNA